MGKAESTLLDKIAKVRAKNRKLYGQLSYAFPLIHMHYPADETLSLIWHAYEIDRPLARSYHRAVLKNDKEIYNLTRELCK